MNDNLEFPVRVDRVVFEVNPRPCPGILRLSAGAESDLRQRRTLRLQRPRPKRLPTHRDPQSAVEPNLNPRLNGERGVVADDDGAGDDVWTSRGGPSSIARNQPADIGLPIDCGRDQAGNGNHHHQTSTSLHGLLPLTHRNGFFPLPPTARQTSEPLKKLKRHRSGQDAGCQMKK